MDVSGLKRQDGYLEEQLLVATPLMGGCFSRSVVFLCSHTPAGAMGLIVNQPLGDKEGIKVFRQFNIPMEEKRKPKAYFGGPVDMARGFVLHSHEYKNADTCQLNPSISLTCNVQILKDIAAAAGPKHYIIALGYAGWGAGQLEREIKANSWITAPSGVELVFAPDDKRKWESAARRVGVDLLKYSGTAGHA